MMVEIHTVYNGMSYRDIADLGPLSPDAVIQQACVAHVCARLGVAASEFDGYVVEVLRDRTPIVVIIRPQAVFGAGGSRPQLEEEDPLRALIRLVTTSTHGDMTTMLTEHGRLFFILGERYAKAAAWYMAGGSYRDHKVAFVVTLATSDPTDGGRYRRLGARLCRDLSVRDVARVIGLVKGTRVTFRRRTTPSFWCGSAGETAQAFVRVAPHTSVPRPLRRAVVEMVRELEANPDRFDRTVLRSRTDLKNLYRRLHIKPSQRADGILFKNVVPADGVLAAYQALRTAPPHEQARLIREYRLPFPAATSVLSSLTPTVVYALVSVMTPNELITNLTALERHGALENQEIRHLIEERLLSAARDDRAIRVKAEQARRHLSPQGQEAIGAYLEEMLKASALVYGRIEGRTLIIVDKSGSMEPAIDAAHALAIMIGVASDPTNVRMIGFDAVVTPILNQLPTDSNGQIDYRAVERSIRQIRPYGGTSPGAAFAYLTKHGIVADRIIIISDGEENTNPPLRTVVPLFFQRHPRVPVIIVKVGQYKPDLEQALANAGVVTMSIDFARGDYYALEDVLRFIVGETTQDIVEEIDAIDIDGLVHAVPDGR